MADGDTLLYIGHSKRAFRCECGANVFHRPAGAPAEKWECNGCGMRYTSTPYDDADRVTPLPQECQETIPNRTRPASR